MSENRRIRPRRLSALLASVVPSWILVPVLLVVPASLPLCAMEVELCAVDLPAVPAGTHCPMDAAGLGEIPCCVSDAAPQEPFPATPGTGDADLRVQPHAPTLAVTPARVLFPAPSEAASAWSPTAAPAALAVPLYTLLSTLLS